MQKVPRSTACYRRKKAAEADAGEGAALPKKAKKAYSCGKCHLPFSSPGHSQYQGARFCPSVNEESKDGWLKKQKAAAELKKMSANRTDAV